MSNTVTIATIRSVALTGFKGTLIDIETALHAGLPALQIVGMGNKAIDEARQRVRTAVMSSLLAFPTQKITVNLAPAELPKDGTHLDLPIALGILVASGQLHAHEVAGALFAGELALNGNLRPIRGSILIAEAARDAGITRLYLPSESAAQAQLVEGIECIPVASLIELYRHLKGALAITARPSGENTPETTPAPTERITIDDITGLEHAKRALAIAAAGRHNILFSGSPGAGKSLLAKALQSLLPPLSSEESIEVTKLHSLSTNTPHVHTTPPLRSPHHHVTLTALIGGGLRAQPGEISLAHKGVLLLDELPEYPRSTLEALRQPLEDRTVTLSRLYGTITYPADILLAATMNPCPCGYYGDTEKECTCMPLQMLRYSKKVSGPLLDRLDLRLTIPRVPHEHFFNSKSMTKKQHSKVLKLVFIARQHQENRFKRSDFYNAYASKEQIEQVFFVTKEAYALLATAAKRYTLSSRASLRVLRVARTIADLESSQNTTEAHVAEALQFRGESPP